MPPSDHPILINQCPFGWLLSYRCAIEHWLVTWIAKCPTNTHSKFNDSIKRESVPPSVCRSAWYCSGPPPPPAWNLSQQLPSSRDRSSSQTPPPSTACLHAPQTLLKDPPANGSSHGRPKSRLHHFFFSHDRGTYIWLRKWLRNLPVRRRRCSLRFVVFDDYFKVRFCQPSLPVEWRASEKKKNPWEKTTCCEERWGYHAYYPSGQEDIVSIFAFILLRCSPNFGVTNKSTAKVALYRPHSTP